MTMRGLPAILTADEGRTLVAPADAVSLPTVTNSSPPESSQGRLEGLASRTQLSAMAHYTRPPRGPGVQDEVMQWGVAQLAGFGLGVGSHASQLVVHHA
jgi:hypothetical protein